VRLVGAHLGGHLDLEGLDVAGDNAMILDLRDAKVTAAMFLSAALVCPNATAGTGSGACAARG
jgi:hypothetical protein